jgi:two-component system response regulator AtoC
MQSLNNKTILVGEDEPEVRVYIEMALREQGFSVELARNGDEVLSFLRSPGTDVAAVLLDLVMPNRDSLDTLRKIRAVDSDLPVIIISGKSSPSDAVAVMKSGATDYICKPFTHEELLDVVIRSLENLEVSYRSGSRHCTVAKLPSFVSSNPRMKEIQLLAPRIGWSGAPVLIQGETGSGKEIVARELHAQSARANRPFMKLNCAALPSELVESELFGYERGAFTGASQKKPGMFELADSGTILLDEIGDMDVRLQAKLLQVLQDQEFRRIGGREVVKVDVRVMAATHRDLEKANLDGAFREDLYYRLNVISIRVPPLRERREDIISIGEYLMKKHATHGVTMPSISPDLRKAMLAYHWPGNVRELENFMRRLMIFRDPDTIARELQSKTMSKSPPTTRADAVLNPSTTGVGGYSVLEQVTKANQQAEIDTIMAALTSTRWNRKQAAARLKIDYKSFLYKMKKLRIEDNPMFLDESQSHSPKTKSADSGPCS